MHSLIKSGPPLLLPFVLEKAKKIEEFSLLFWGIFLLLRVAKIGNHFPWAAWKLPQGLPKLPLFLHFLLYPEKRLLLASFQINLTIFASLSITDKNIGLKNICNQEFSIVHHKLIILHLLNKFIYAVQYATCTKKKRKIWKTARKKKGVPTLGNGNWTVLSWLWQSRNYGSPCNCIQRVESSTLSTSGRLSKDLTWCWQNTRFCTVNVLNRAKSCILSSG